MALEDAAAAVQAVDPSQIPVVTAAAVALEARRSAAAMRKSLHWSTCSASARRIGG
jgi:hypothetical protein